MLYPAVLSLFDVFLCLQATDRIVIRGHTETTSCNSYILNADRVMAIQEMKEFFDDLWDSSHCDSM